MRKLILVVALWLVVSSCYAANLTTNNSTFDTSIDTYTALSDNIDYVLSSHVNGPMSAIVNIENVLGTGLKGTQATLATRLDQMLAGSGAIKSGTSFPTSPTPVNAQLFWRSDLKALYIYDGVLAQWQQVQIPATFNFSSPSAYTLSLYHNNTAGRTITFPDITDTLVTLTANQTLTNKTIDDASNTLTVLETSITDGSLLARLAGNETVTGQWTFAPSSGVTTFNANSSAFALKLVGRSSGTQGAEIDFYANDGTTIQGLFNASSEGVRIRSAGATPSIFIKPTGEVGIGETTPSTILHVTESSLGYVATIEQASTGSVLNLKSGNDGSPALAITDAAGTTDTVYIMGNGRFDVVVPNGTNLAGIYPWQFKNQDVTSGQGYGLRVEAGNGSSDYSMSIASRAGASALFTVRGDGTATVGPLLDGDSRFHIYNASAGTIGAASNTNLTIENNNANFISMLAPKANSQGILFGNPTDGNTDGQVIYNNNARELYFYAGGITKLTVNSTGQLVSSLATGTAPLSVASTTKVTNLNADLLDGNDAAAFATAGHNHSGVYSPVGHNHSGVYSPVGHNHTEIIYMSSAGTANYNPGNSYYEVPNGGFVSTGVDSIAALKMLDGGTLTHFGVYIYSNASDGTFTVEIYKNGAATGNILTVSAGGTGWQEWSTGMSFSANDTISFKLTNNGSTGSISLRQIRTRMTLTI